MCSREGAFEQMYKQQAKGYDRVIVFSDQTLPAMIASELLRITLKSQVSVVYVTGYEDTEDFFAGSREVECSKVYLIGDVSDEYTNEMITESGLATEVVGLSDMANTAEGRDWIRYCGAPVATLYSDPNDTRDDYFRGICRILSDDEPRLLSIYRKLLKIVDGTDVAGLSRLIAIYLSYDVHSFAQWLEDRLRAMRDTSADILRVEDKQVAERILYYKSSLEDSILSLTIEEDQQVFIVVLSSDEGTTKRLLGLFGGKQRINFAALEQGRVFSIVSGYKAGPKDEDLRVSDVFKYKGKEYTLISRTLDIRKLFECL